MLTDLTAKGLVVAFPEDTSDTVWCSDLIASLIWLSSVYPNRFVFRGHSRATYDLQSRLARIVRDDTPGATYATVIAREKLILADVREANWFADVPNDRRQRLSILQHRRVPTRLLDVTSDPLVASYFAVEKDASIDGAVVLIRDLAATALMSREGTLTFKPVAAPYAIWSAPPLHGRMISQRGAFLVVNPNINGSTPSLNSPYGMAKFNAKGTWAMGEMQRTVNNYLNGRYRGRPKKNPPNAVLFVIPSGKKQALNEMLGRFGLTKRSIYPDLEGYASSFPD